MKATCTHIESHFLMSEYPIDLFLVECDRNQLRLWVHSRPEKFEDFPARNTASVITDFWEFPAGAGDFSLSFPAGSGGQNHRPWFTLFFVRS